MDAATARDYNRVALSVNGPVYDFYARRILEKTGITAGSCLDVGCGGGYLGLALARITTLDFIFLDSSPEILAHAEKNIIDFGLTGRAVTLLGQVQTIPLAAGSVELVISRGSIPFWDELPAAFGEIRRVLKPGGRAYVGGGLGDPKTRAALQARMKRECPQWGERPCTIPRHDDNHYTGALEAAGIDSFTLTRNDEGMWIEIRKE